MRMTIITATGSVESWTRHCVRSSSDFSSTSTYVTCKMMMIIAIMIMMLMMIIMVTMRNLRKLTSNFCSLPRSPRKVTKSVPLDLRLPKYHYDDYDCDYGGLAGYNGDGDDYDYDHDDVFIQPFLNWLTIFPSINQALDCIKPDIWLSEIESRFRVRI